MNLLKIDNLYEFVHKITNFLMSTCMYKKLYTDHTPGRGNLVLKYAQNSNENWRNFAIESIARFGDRAKMEGGAK